MLRTARLRLTLLLTALTPAVCSAQEPGAAPKLPDEAARLKQTYEQEKERAIQLLRERYLTDLKRSLDAATRGGKLAEALAIKGEIDDVSADSPDTTAGFERRMEGIKWKWNNGREITFSPDKTGGGDMTWKTLAPYTIEYQYPNGNHGTIVFERSLSRAAINEILPNGKKATLPLTRAKE
jgi:hypothetical protein